MITENLSTLQIHKLSQAQYDRVLANGDIDENAMYLVPDEEVDLSGYVTEDQLNGKADAEHTHDDRYYTESEIDTKIADSKAYVDAEVAKKADSGTVTTLSDKVTELEGNATTIKIVRWS